MKKALSFLFVFLMIVSFASCGEDVPSEEKIPDLQEPQNELGEDSKILEGCVFITADEKYGVHRDGKIILPAKYEEFKKVGELGGKMFYALGYKEGTKACFEWNKDGMLIGKGETERTLYDIFDRDGNMLLSFPVDDFYNEDGKNLHVTLEGSKYFYAFSDDGEIEREEVYKKGKEWPNLFGFDTVRYYYNASPFGCFWGLADFEGNIVVPEIYTEFETYFGSRIIAKTHSAMVGYSAFRLYDSECNLLCEKYSTIEYYDVGKGFIGIGKCDYPESQSPLICRDENGEIMPGGFWFIDENGNALSGHFDIKAAEINILEENKTAVVTDIDGNITEIPFGDYIFEIER